MSAGFVTKGSRVADIGCDHAHTDIWLLENGIASYCIACDVRTGPLKKAEENIARYGQGDKIELRLSYGLHEIAPGEVDSVIIAGMGGLLICDILEEAGGKLQTFKELILQPHSHSLEVRRFLERAGFGITDEVMCREDDKYYPCIHAVLGGSRELGEAEAMYGPVLLGKQDKVLEEYLQIEYRKAKLRLARLEHAKAPEAEEKKRYFENIVRTIGGIKWITLE